MTTVKKVLYYRKCGEIINHFGRECIHLLSGKQI